KPRRDSARRSRNQSSADFQVYQYLPKSSQPAKIFLTTDGHGLTRMKMGFLLSVSIRVHPWLDHIGCGFAALRRIAGFQTRRWHDITRPADLEIGDTAGLETCATTRSCGAGKFEKEQKSLTNSSTDYGSDLGREAGCVGRSGVHVPTR